MTIQRSTASRGKKGRLPTSAFTPDSILSHVFVTCLDIIGKLKRKQIYVSTSTLFQNNTEKDFLLFQFRYKQLFLFADLHHTFLMGGYLSEQYMIPSFHLFCSLKNKLLTIILVVLVRQRKFYTRQLLPSGA